MHGTMTAAEVADQRFDQADEGTRSFRGAWIAWGLGAVCYFAALFHRASLGVSAPDALQRFSAGPAVLALFSALQLGVYLALQVPSGLLADRLGPRKVISGGMVALAVGTVVFGVSGSVVGGITGRTLIGLGDAFMFTNVLRLAAQWFPAERFGRVAALTGLVGGIGQLVATVPLAASLHELGWVSTFLGAGAITAVFAVMAAWCIRDRPASTGYMPGEVREPLGRTLREVLAQRGTKHSFWVHFVLMSQFVAVTTLWGSPWLTQSQGHSKTDAGTMLLICVLGFIGGAWLAGRYLSGRRQRRESATLWLSLAVVSAWTVVVIWPGQMPVPLLLTTLLVMGVGGGAAMLAFDGARSANAGHRSGTASGVVNMGGFTAAVLIQLLVGIVLQTVAWLPAVDAYRWAFVPVLALTIFGTLAQSVWRAPRTSDAPDESPAEQGRG